MQDGYISAVGHEGAAKFLSWVLDADIKFCRIPVSLKPGDTAIALRILGRLPEGLILDSEQLKHYPFELSLLRRIK